VTPKTTPSAVKSTAAPVSYPGFAPTGSRAASTAASLTPLAALGTVVLLTAGAGLVWYRIRSRAARAED
jgi:hypothetical protein